ncbi:MAG TPA: MBL fold metallo-hydrolase, partial [Candidatus Dormibacteraeota bacterium]|nr:MBL fold metallo-hydrolase [Candidatus Dormibacteraeota bacterium]
MKVPLTAMHSPICLTCGVQYPPSEAPPKRCEICEDERQYVGWSGQTWTTLEDLRRDHRNEIRDDLGLTGIGTKPSFAIGQRALLVRSPQGNLLWDCVTVIDDATVAEVREMGGVRAIAISHPHYYSAMVEWGRSFDAPILLHAADRQWVMRPDPRIEHWTEETRQLWDGMTLIR